jgi:predicted small metal-binding protein
MTKSISCSDAGKDCKWSASTEEELMEKVTQHVIEEHKEIELNAESISSIKSLIKDI